MNWPAPVALVDFRGTSAPGQALESVWVHASPFQTEVFIKTEHEVQILNSSMGTALADAVEDAEKDDAVALAVHIEPDLTVV